MRALLPEPADDVNLHQWYARDWVERGGIRVNMITSIDGAAAAKGLSEGLQTPGDNHVFAALRDLADVVLAGSGTVRAEGYAPIELGERRTELRRQYGLRPALPTAVATRSMHLDPSSALFAEAHSDARPIVLTTESADPAARAAFEPIADVIVCGERDLDIGQIRRALADRGLTRVLCEGGPTLFSQVAAAGEADEVCLTVAPLLVGPGAARIVAGNGWTAGPRRLTLDGVLEEDGGLFLRLVAASG